MNCDNHRKATMKTLYISDLDGTLLNNDETLSEFTATNLNGLLEKGVVFSFATARSYTTAKKVTPNLKMKYPAVVHNGTFIVDKDGNILKKNTFSKQDSTDIINTLLKSGVNPVVYSLINEKEQFSYIREKLNSETLNFLSSRKNDPRKREVFDIQNLYDGEVYYFTLIGDEDKTKPLFELYKDRYQCYFQRDIYSNDYWLEILPQGATKADGVKQLAKLLGCDRIVAFGDGVNDIEMFKIADECYAVENACDKLKQIATKVIASNVQNGVVLQILSSNK